MNYVYEWLPSFHFPFAIAIAIAITITINHQYVWLLASILAFLACAWLMDDLSRQFYFWRDELWGGRYVRASSVVWSALDSTWKDHAFTQAISPLTQCTMHPGMRDAMPPTW